MSLVGSSHHAQLRLKYLLYLRLSRLIMVGCVGNEHLAALEEGQLSGARAAPLVIPTLDKVCSVFSK